MKSIMPKRYFLVLGTFLLSVLLYIDRVCISAAKDAIALDLNLSDKQMGWVLSAFALGYALFQTPSGMLADKFGPRKVLTGVVTFWSIFTGLTGAAFNFVSMLVYRLLFGVGEAGAFPGIARATFSWIPMKERGLVTGINFSGSRLGAAFALPLVAWMVSELGWRLSFTILMFIGFAWALFWVLWFRDDPTQKKSISQKELDHILETRQSAKAQDDTQLSAGLLLKSKNMWVAMGQYFCSNFTFFFTLTWLFPYIKKTYSLDPVNAAFYSALPLVGGAFGNWFSGWLIDKIYKSDKWVLSRRLPAILGFALAAIGLVASIFMQDVLPAVLFLTVAIFGADMTLPPSWSFCVDVGKKHSGAVSGTMNMAGNIGSFVTGLAFPYLFAWTGSAVPFFVTGAVLNIIAIGLWLLARPDKSLEDF